MTTEQITTYEPAHSVQFVDNWSDEPRLTRISPSGLKKMIDSPMTYWDDYVNPNRPEKETTPSMRFGSALHMYLTQLEEFNKKYMVAPKFDRRTTAGKELALQWELLAQENNATIITEPELESVQLASEVIAGHKLANRILSNLSNIEQKVEFNGNRRLILDGISKEFKSVVEIKTTKDASQLGFAKEAANLGYYLQLADQVQATGSEGAIVIAIQNKRPYNLTVFYMAADDPALVVNYAIVAEQVAKWEDCKEKYGESRWPSYGSDNEFVQLAAPKWYFL